MKAFFSPPPSSTPVLGTTAKLQRDDDFSGSLLDVLLAASIENGYSSMDAWVTTVMPYFGDACALIAFAHMIRRREQMQDLANRTLGYFGRCDVVGEGKETARAVKDALLTTLKVRGVSTRTQRNS